MKVSIAVIPGDGTGPEVMAPATAVLDAVGCWFGHNWNYVELLAGGCAIDAAGEPLPAETLEAAKQCYALLLGAVGGPKASRQGFPLGSAPATSPALPAPPALREKKLPARRKWVWRY